METITTDKGYDWDEFNHYLREEGVKPVIKHREFNMLDAAHNARIDDNTYHRRSVVESIFAYYVVASTTRFEPEPGPANSANSSSKPL